MRHVVQKTYGIALLIGNVTADSEFYLTRQGEPKIVFRLAIDRCFDFDFAAHDVDNRKASADFFTVEAQGDVWTDLELRRGDRVLVIGLPRSRDANVNGEPRVITYFQPLLVQALHYQAGGDPARYRLMLADNSWNSLRPGVVLVQLSLALKSQQQEKRRKL